MTTAPAEAARTAVVEPPPGYAVLPDDPALAESFVHAVAGLASPALSEELARHRLAEVLEVCSRVTVLRDGRNVGTFPTEGMTQTRLTELMKQPQYRPLTNAEIVIVIYAGTKGYIDNVPVRDVVAWEDGLIQFLRNQKADLLDDMTRNDRKIAGELEDAIKAALSGYAKTYA